MKEEPKIIELLHELESILGSQCYNGNIQNYGSWGEWVGEGRSFRYPVRYKDDEGNTKKYSTKVPLDFDENYKPKYFHLSEEQMNGAHYAFGANQLFVFQGVRKILNHLEERYSISFEELEKIVGKQKIE